MIVNTLKVSDIEFPQALKQIDPPPRAIYWAGQPFQNWLSKPRVAVVGSRKCTPYGTAVTSRLAGDLARAGVVIVSGLAFGVDVTAHQAALEAGGQTVAVLGSSLDQITPTSHQNIARRILGQGALLSEYPPGSNTYAGNFVIRNRIISGLADVVVIPEAALKSGSLHTARFALEQGKTVMAVPGNINSFTSEGCNNLIKSGAVPVTSADDIFFALKMNIPKTKTAKNINGTAAEKLVYRLIGDGIAGQEELALASKIEGSALSSALTMLEISGHIRAAGGGNWVIA